MRALALPMALAAGLTLVYAAFFAPMWTVHFDDHLEYVALARGLVERGEYTRAVVGEAFVPEPLRLPGYPLFLGAVCALRCDPWGVAVAQALVFAALIPLTHAVMRRIDERVAVPAAWATALYLPLPFYAARPLSDFNAAFLLMLTAYAFFKTLERRTIGWGVAFGASCAWLGLTRPVFLPVFVAFAAVAWLVRDRSPVRARTWALAAAAFAALMAPVVVQQMAYFGTPISGSTGALLWLGIVQERTADPEGVERYERAAHSGAADADLVALGAAVGLDAEESIVGADVKRRVGAFETIPDRLTQAYAFVELDRYLRGQALRVIAHDPGRWLLHGITVRTVELWGGGDPLGVPGSAPPYALDVASIAVRLVIAAVAVIGLIVGLRGGARAMWLPALLLAYVWIVSFPFWTEGRYSLPVAPFELAAAVVGARRLVGERRVRNPAAQLTPVA